MQGNAEIGQDRVDLRSGCISNDCGFFGILGLFAIIFIVTIHAISNLVFLGIFFVLIFFDGLPSPSSWSLLSKTSNILEFQEGKVKWFSGVLNLTWHSSLWSWLFLILEGLFVELKIGNVICLAHFD